MSDGPRAVVIDAGVGNLGNLARALSQVGARPAITSEPAEVEAGRCLLLPGVGAFRPPRERLRGALEAALHRALEAGAWLLGICVGYQLLFAAGEEFGTTDGLGLLPGTVRHLPDAVPLPHIGWNRLHDLADHPLLAGVGERHVYFVHSFAPAEVPPSLCLAQVTHGVTFPAVVGEERVLGTQFHPEKSGEPGLRLLANFVAMSEGADERGR